MLATTSSREITEWRIEYRLRNEDEREAIERARAERGE